MVVDPIAVLASFLVTYAIHGALTLGAVGLIARTGRVREPIEEALWRFALVGSLITASLQIANGGAWLAAIPIESAATSVSVVEPSFGVADAAAAGRVDVAVPLGAGAPVTALAAAALDWRILTVAVLASLGLLGLGRLGVRRVALRRLLADRRPLLAGGPAHDALEELCERAGVRGRVRLSVSAELDAPVAFGVLRPEICVPRRALHGMSAPARNAMLAHELAHIACRDPLWLEVAHTLSAIFPWQPLLRVAARRMRTLAEFRCDAYGARLTGPVDVADCLVEVAGWITGSPRFAATEGLVGMTVQREGLGARVDRLLDSASQQRSTRLSPGVTALSSLAAIGILSAALPGAGPRDLVSTPAVDAVIGEVADVAPSPAVDPEVRALRDLLALLELERDALASELEALAIEVAARPPDDELAALLDQLERRIHGLGERRDALTEMVESYAAARTRSAGTIPEETETHR